MTRPAGFLGEGGGNSGLGIPKLDGNFQTLNWRLTGPEGQAQIVTIIYNNNFVHWSADVADQTARLALTGLAQYDLVRQTDTGDIYALMIPANPASDASWFAIWRTPPGYRHVTHRNTNVNSQAQMLSLATARRFAMIYRADTENIHILKTEGEHADVTQWLTLYKEPLRLQETVANEAARLALPVSTPFGYGVIQNDFGGERQFYILCQTGDPSDLTSWCWIPNETLIKTMLADVAASKAKLAQTKVFTATFDLDASTDPAANYIEGADSDVTAAIVGNGGGLYRVTGPADWLLDKIPRIFFTLGEYTSDGPLVDGTVFTTEKHSDNTIDIRFRNLLGAQAPAKSNGCSLRVEVDV